jgi:hypothetical protein
MGPFSLVEEVGVQLYMATPTIILKEVQVTIHSHTCHSETEPGTLGFSFLTLGDETYL